MLPEPKKSANDNSMGFMSANNSKSFQISNKAAERIKKMFSSDEEEEEVQEEVLQKESE